MTPDDRHLAERTPGVEEAAQMARKHIFCVNGASEFLEVLRALFEDELFNVTTTNYVPRTFEQIDALNPDLIVLDLEVTHQAGWALLERLTAEASTRAIPVVITSTDQRLLDTANADPGRYGEHVTIVKPLDIDVLLDTVRQAIGVA